MIDKILSTMVVERETDNLEIRSISFDINKLDGDSNFHTTITPRANLTKVTLSDDYKPNEILEKFIDKVTSICDTSTYKKILKEHVIEEYSEDNIRKLMCKMMNSSTYIAVRGRIGPAQYVLLPTKYYEILLTYTDQLNRIGELELIPTDLLKDRFIFGRKNGLEEPGMILVLNEYKNTYDMVITPGAENQYHILKVIERIKDKNLKTIRNLSGIYFRSKNPETGKWDSIVFEDLPEEEQDELLENKSKEWVVSLAKKLAKTINDLGDTFDIIAK